MMMRILTLGLLTTGALLVFAPHASAYTYCNGVLYNPLNGNEMVTQCDDYYYDSNGCWYDTYYYSQPVTLYYEDVESCSDGSSYCYLGLVYYNSNIRAGLC
jgi:hypothetical protein